MVSRLPILSKRCICLLQVEMMKKQLETIPPDKPDICCHPISDKPALGDRFLELAEILKNHDHRVKRVQEDATEKLKEAEKAYQSEMQLVRFALAKSEKMNLEYLKSVKVWGLLLFPLFCSISN